MIHRGLSRKWKNGFLWVIPCLGLFVIPAPALAECAGSVLHSEPARKRSEGFLSGNPWFSGVGARPRFATIPAHEAKTCGYAPRGQAKSTLASRGQARA